MRRTIRPFVKEIKTRWSKSSKSRAQTDSEMDKPRFTHPFPSVEATSQALDREDDDYRAALKAADAAFGTPHQIASKDALPSPHVGRVLPSLVEETASEPVYPPKPKEKLAAERKPRKKGPISKAKKPASPAARKAPAPSQAPNAKLSTVAEQQSGNSVTQADPSTRREDRPLQQRWVLKTGLKAGEKWKRRLRKRAS